MATILEFKLSDLIVAIINNNNYNIGIMLEERPEEGTWAMNAQEEMEWEVVPAYRDDYMTITTPEGKRYSFKDTYKKDKEIIVWLSQIPSNDKHITLLNELEVPYQRV